MFVRTKTTPNSPRKSIQIVESFRDPKTSAVKQKILRHVGIAMDDAEEEKLKLLALDIIAKMKVEQEKASRQIPLISLSQEDVLNSLRLEKKLGRKPRKSIQDVLPVDQVTLDMIREESRLIDGVHEVVGHVYDELGYSSLFSNKNYGNILKDLVLCRISDPASKMKTQSLLERYYAKNHKLESVYRSMDHLFDRIDAIKKATFDATARLLPQEIDVVLFDVTTLYFESTDVDELRAFGYSKDFRFNTTQVVLALATNIDGLPIGYELFEGNKAEVSTLMSALEDWKKLFKIKDVCFIGDRAMFCQENLKKMEESGYHYIVAAKLKSLPCLIQKKILSTQSYDLATLEGEAVRVKEFIYDEADLQILKEQGAKPQTLRAYQKQIESHKNRRFVVSYSAKRAHRDSQKREVMLDKIQRQLDQTSNSAKLISNTGLKKFTSSQGESQTSIDQSKVKEDQDWDGIHGVITNMKNLNSEEVLSQYRRLVKIEDCFRVSKSILKMRPIYHFKKERIYAHVAMCYMAFAVVRHLEYKVRLVKKLSIASMIEELNSVQSSIYIHKVTSDRYRVPGAFSNNARKIYKALNLERNLDAHPIL
jgi:transposase